MRLDLFLVQKKWAVSRTQAQDLIKAGFVYLNTETGKTILSKTNFEVVDKDQARIAVEVNDLQKFVSRGGLKLESALKHVQLSVQGLMALDVGQSTGGFTDCLLQSGAAHVVGLDVGSGQLHLKIESHPRVTSFESLHVNQLSQDSGFQKAIPAQGFDLMVADVSFISLNKVMPYLKPYLKKDGRYLFLVKPQFELDRNALDKNGVVKDEKNYSVVQNEVTSGAVKLFGSVLDYFMSALEGKDGNREFFIYGQNKH